MPAPPAPPAPEHVTAALAAADLCYLLSLNPQLPQQLSLWLCQLQKNRRNLTAVREPAAALRKHALEPLRGRHRLYGADLPIPHGPLLDLGSGNGAPGLPLALADPDRPAILLDANRHSTQFLQTVITALQLKHVQAVQARAEAAAHTPLRETFALAVSRAAAPPAAAVELLLPFLQVGGLAVLWTGELTPADTAAVTTAAQQLGGMPSPVDPPADLLVFTKQSPAPARYPRPWPQIRRRPLT